MKCKAIEEDRNEDEGMKVDEGESEERVKRTRTATERVDRLLMEVSQD